MEKPEKSKSGKFRKIQKKKNLEKVNLEKIRKNYIMQNFGLNFVKTSAYIL